MAKTEGHSKLPWKTQGSGVVNKENVQITIMGTCYMGGIDNIDLAQKIEKANAEFIVKCVNSHDKLLEALRDLVQYGTDAIDTSNGICLRDKAIEAIKEAENNG